MMVGPGVETATLRAICADIKATKNIDFVPAFWRVLAINPSQLELVWTTLKSLMHPESVGRTPRLDPTTREIIALAGIADAAVVVGQDRAPTAGEVSGELPVDFARHSGCGIDQHGVLLGAEG